MHEVSASVDKSLVRLNVGGTLYTVASDTLMKFPDSVLSKLVCERRSIVPAKNVDEPIFIERDGGRFKYVLDGYRDGRVVLPRDVAIGAVENDMRYFGLSRVLVRQEKPSLNECLLGTREGLLQLAERLKIAIVGPESKYQLRCASSLGNIPEGVKNGSEAFALWAVREAILQYVTNNEGSYEAFLHEYLKIYPSSRSRPDLSHSLGLAYKILRGWGLCSINVICTRRYHALAFSFSEQNIRVDMRRNSF